MAREVQRYESLSPAISIAERDPRRPRSPSLPLADPCSELDLPTPRAPRSTSESPPPSSPHQFAPGRPRLDIMPTRLCWTASGAASSRFAGRPAAAPGSFHGCSAPWGCPRWAHLPEWLTSRVVTLIVTTISNLGILQASDSNLTAVDRSGRITAAGTGQKVFRLDFCSGALALAGSYAVGGIRMDTWMTTLVSNYSTSAAPTIGGFARHLQARLIQEGTPGETSSLIQVAGYAEDVKGLHPEMWFIRNFGGIDPITGAYIDRSDVFEISEDFWARDYPADAAVGHTSLPGYARRYFNGAPEGRISFHVLDRYLREFFSRVWTNPKWAFRQPRDAAEMALFMRVELDVIAALFAVSDYPAAFVGGEVQVEVIPRPGKAAQL